MRSQEKKTAPQVLTERTRTDFMGDKLGAPKIVDRRTFQLELDALQAREKAHAREGDAIAAARRRLSMVEVEPHHHVDWPATTRGRSSRCSSAVDSGAHNVPVFRRP